MYKAQNDKWRLSPYTGCRYTQWYTWYGVRNRTIGIANSFTDIDFLRAATLGHEFINSKSH